MFDYETNEAASEPDILDVQTEKRYVLYIYIHIFFIYTNKHIIHLYGQDPVLMELFWLQL